MIKGPTDIAAEGRSTFPRPRSGRGAGHWQSQWRGEGEKSRGLRFLAALLLVSASFGACASDWDYSTSDWGTGDWDWSEPAGDALDSFDNAYADPADLASETDPEFEQDEVLAINLSALGEAAAHKLGFTVLEVLPLPSLHFSVTRLRMPDGFRPRRALDSLRKADPQGQYGSNPIYRLAGRKPVPGKVEGAEPAQSSALRQAQDTACEGLRCYGQTLVGWSPGCKLSARIGMLDSAVDTQSPALRGSRVFSTRISPTTASEREQEHGTAVAALLVGNAASGFAGALPESKLFAADVFRLDRREQPYTDALTLAQGLEWLAHQKLDVLNISISGPDSVVLHKAVQNLAERGVAMAAAAGNLGEKAPPQYPAAYAEVMAVTAVDRRLQVYDKANHGAYIRVAAPGVGIWTAGNGGAGVFRDGTSFASPFVAAALAINKTAQPRLTPAALIEALSSRARDLGAPGKDPVYGAGLLQAPACRAQRVVS